MGDNRFYELTLNITGHVQGVNFRRFICDTARELRLVGWVRNNDDETVAAIAQGGRASLEKLRDTCVQGPRSAQVTMVEDSWKEIPRLEFDRFQIIYYANPGIIGNWLNKFF